MSKIPLKERLAKKKKELKSRAETGKVVFIKADTTIRVRILPVPEDEDFVAEIATVYLGKDIGGVYSPSTYGDACPVVEKYEELKKSKKSSDKDLAKKLVPKQKYLIPVVLYEDDKGKKISDKSPVLVQITSGLYKEIIDLYLDEAEWGDMTDPKNGYDLKLTRTGSTMTDTEYSVKPCKNTELPKPFSKKKVDLNAMVKEIMPTYEEALDKLNEFLSGAIDDDDEPSSSEKKKKKKIKKDI